jgi:sugar-specific transcriptional regulator TrmB
VTRTLILKRFRDLGLSSYEAKSYLSLLERDTLTVSEVSKLAGIPRPNAYDALEKLMTKGLCISKPGDVKKYSASDPVLLQEKFLVEVRSSAESELETLRAKEREILEKSKLSTEAELESLRKKEMDILEKSKTATEAELENLRKKEKEIREKGKAAEENVSAMVEELRPLYDKTRQEFNPLEYIQVIKDPYQVHKRYMELVREIKEEYLGIVKGPYTGPPEKLKDQINLGVEALKRGVKFRSVYEPPGDRDQEKWLSEFIERLAEHGAEARIAKSLPMKTAIFDSRVVLFALADPVSKELSLTSQVTEHPALAQSLKILFEYLWGQAQDYHKWRNSRR